MRFREGATILVILISLGCKNPFGPTDIRAYIYSDTRWSGNFDDRLFVADAYGNAVIDLRDDIPICVTVQKLTPEGYLSLKITDRDSMITIQPFGIVKDCPREQ